MRINSFYKRGFITILFVCSILLCFAQCKQDGSAEFKSKGGLRVLVGLDNASQKSDNETVEIRNQVMKVLRNRIGTYGVTPHVEWLEADKQILVEIPGVQDPERVLQLLRKETNLEFWETYELADIYASILSVDERLAQLITPDRVEDEDQSKTIASSGSGQDKKQSTDELDSLLKRIESSESGNGYSLSSREFEGNHPLFAKLQINIYENAGSFAPASGPVVGHAIVDDMDRVMEYLNMEETKSILPSDLLFSWGAKPVDEGGRLYELYALKKTMSKGAVLDGNVVTEAKVESDGQGGNAIGLLMNEEGARMWARMTKVNIGKSIAMVVDDRVYSAPRVNAEITGGRSMISGHFTREEANDLANLLDAGRMPAPIRIIKYEVVLPDPK